MQTPKNAHRHRKNSAVQKKTESAISRVLFQMIHGPETLNQPVTIIYLRRTLLPGSSSLPESRPVTDRHCFLFGLASDGVYLATWVTPNAGELLPHRFTLTRRCAIVAQRRAVCFLWH